MDKIATTSQLQRELQRLLTYAESKRPSRSRFAHALQELSYRVAAAVDPEKFEQFSKAYRKGKLEAIKANPDQFIGKREDESLEEFAERGADKMLKSIKENPKGVNYDGAGFRRACKILGIKATRKAIFEFLGYS